jgi:hypothetical protein
MLVRKNKTQHTSVCDKLSLNASQFAREMYEHHVTFLALTMSTLQEMEQCGIKVMKTRNFVGSVVGLNPNEIHFGAFEMRAHKHFLEKEHCPCESLKLYSGLGKPKNMLVCLKLY